MRSIKKGAYMLKEIVEQVKSGKKTIIIKDTAVHILPFLIDKICLVYNGKRFFKIVVNKKMIGRRFGEFILTRFFRQHTFVTKKAKVKLKK